MGKGKVNADGLPADGEKAIGVPSFVMIKVCARLRVYGLYIDCCQWD